MSVAFLYRGYNYCIHPNLYRTDKSARKIIFSTIYCYRLRHRDWQIISTEKSEKSALSIGISLTSVFAEFLAIICNCFDLCFVCWLFELLLLATSIQIRVSFCVPDPRGRSNFYFSITI